MWDNHCHLADFDGQDLEQILQKAQKVGVEYFLTSASSFDNFDANLKIADSFKNVFVAIGLHPLFLPDMDLTSAGEKLVRIIRPELQKNPKKLMALGEIGLDFRAKLSEQEKSKQVNFFSYQLELAQKLDLPAVLHIQKAHQKTIEILQKSNFNKGGLVHAFNSGINEAEFYCKNGFKLGIGTSLLNPKSTNLLAKISKLELKDLVLETDSPFMSPFADRNNEPANLLLVVEKLAQIFSTSKDEIIKITDANSQNLWSY